MGKNFKGTLERGRRGAEQGGMRGMVQGLQDGFRGIPKMSQRYQEWLVKHKN